MSHFVGYRKAKRLSGSEFRTSRLWKSVRGKPGRLVTKIRRPTARVTRRFAAKLRYQQTEYPVAPAEGRLQTPVNASVMGTPRRATTDVR